MKSQGVAGDIETVCKDGSSSDALESSPDLLEPRQRSYTHSSRNGLWRASAAPRNLTTTEAEFLELARKGNVSCVQSFLNNCPKINVNAESFEGETALRLAVQHGNEALVVFLCSLKSIDMGDVVLHAIRYQQVVILKLLCDSFDLDKKRSYAASSDFPQYVTPLSLAAVVGSYETIDYLLNVRGHALLPEPQNVHGCCTNSQTGSDSIVAATGSLHLYTAISEPRYYVHTTDNPIVHSFKLHRCLLNLSNSSVPFNTAFLRLAERVQTFAVDLIAECKTSEEVRTILSRGTEEDTFWSRLHKNQLPTLMMAMEYHQKSFIAHPNVQVVLSGMWIGDFHLWKVMHPLQKATLLVRRLFLAPYVYYLLLVDPKSASTRHYSLPVNKMLTSIAFYIAFLSVVFWGNTTAWTAESRALKGLKWSITVFVVALTVSAIRQSLILSPKRFFSNVWNLYDVSILTAFWLAIAFWISAAVGERSSDDALQKSWGDPTILAEGSFVIGSVLAYLKLLFFCQTNYTLGPMQAAMNSTVRQFFKYSCVGLLIMISFTIALTKYYSYYRTATNDLGWSDLYPSHPLGPFVSTFKTLFWGIFRVSSLTVETVKIRNVLFTRQHYFTQVVWYLAFGSYLLLMGVIISNMVIATMGAAFAKMLSDVDTEWTISKTQIYTYYMGQPALPPPLNVLPHSQAKSDGLSQREPTSSDKAFNQLVKKLVVRYFRTNAKRTG